ncbi:formimidoylglutamate deiminase [Actinomadura sp. WMMB 499]|uniref:formimidoylglutamate deiminase n=1 Tax=Actinomadura sp. WMMB 499 TaxID=1219491 RepID=UPI0012446C75|nr:formimidoylglutamate deiminase [Actinomadura sp. WMMB 499]QFG25231.1 formimidoylglutamate deiminase [Actinomadura sp. WMMB 499]
MQWHAQFAWLGDGVAADVLVEADGERITRVERGAAAPPGAVRLPGLTLPGLANAHSHAFHRALRSRAQRQPCFPQPTNPDLPPGTFWTWREQMYRVADRLDPESYRALAAAAFAEMALAGISCVGEFHYLHHRPGGDPYDEPNAMGEALIAAAADAGIRITLLDACYLTGGIGAPLTGTQLRFGDGTAGNWARRAGALHDGLHKRTDGRTDGTGGGHARVGAAIHSVRAVPREQLAAVAAWARERRAPLHVHLSEQPEENAACREAYGTTPARLLAEAGALGAFATAVHATHLTGEDIGLLGTTTTGVCMCPTTERDLADGIGPARDLAAAGAPLCLGTDQHAVVDLFEEARAVELDERLRTRRRGHWTAGELLTAATRHGHYGLGWPEAGRLEPGGYADLVTVDLGSVRTAGAGPAHAAEAAVFAATAADVRHVVVSGREIVRDGRHLLIEDVPGALAAAIDAVTRDTFTREDHA